MQPKPFPKSQSHGDWRESKSRRPFFRSLLGESIAIAGESSSLAARQTFATALKAMNVAPQKTEDLIKEYTSVERTQAGADRMELKIKLVDKMQALTDVGFPKADCGCVRVGYGAAGLMNTIRSWDRLELAGMKPDSTASLYLLDLQAGLNCGGQSSAPFRPAREILPSQLTDAKGRVRAQAALEALIEYFDANSPVMRFGEE